MNLSERIRTVSRLDPTAPAVFFGEETITWGEVAARMDAIDVALDEAGVGEAGEVAVVLRNRPEHLASILALLATGRCLTTISAVAGDIRLVADLGALDGCPVIAEPADWQRPGVDDAVSATGGLGLELTAIGVKVRHPGTAAGTPRPGVAVRMQTSGTTGAPKRVELSYAALAGSITGAAHYESDADGEARLRRGVRLCWTPLAHISGLFAVVKNAVDGRPTALMERFDVGEWASNVRRYAVPVSGLVPAAIRMILDAGVPREDLASLKAVIAGTAPTPPELVDRFYDTYGIPILIVYGATEFAGAVAGWTIGDFHRWWPEKRGSVGRAHPGIALRIVDPDTGEPVGPGTVGRLEVRNERVGGAAGAGWVRTTDLAHLDDDGFLFIGGRADDAILRGGFKVSPDRVADALRSHPGVRDAGVVGVADERLGAVPVAAVEIHDGAGEPPTEADLLDHLRALLAPYEVPSRILVVEELPRTSSLKVSQPDLRKLFTT